MPELFKYAYRILPIDLTQGLTNFELPIDAEKIVYASPTDGPEITIRLQAQSNDAIPLRPQGEIVAPFQRMYISAAPIAKVISLLVGSPKDIQLTGRDVVVSGVVSMKQWEERRMETGQLFTVAIELTPGVGLINPWQVFNPASNTKIVVVESANVQSNVAQLYSVRPYNTLLPSGGGIPVNHLNGLANNTATIRFDSVAAALGVDDILRPRIAVETPVTLPVWYTLAPGKGIIFQPLTANARNTINWCRFYEF